jgi:multiple sugar transport system substrate-binding protein
MQSNLPIPQNRLILIGAIALIAIGIFVAFSFFSAPPTQNLPKITVWGTDPEAAMYSAISEYNKKKIATVSYVQVPAIGFEDKVRNALAAGEGPDLFYISNRDIRSLEASITPLVSQTFNIGNFKSLFPSVVETDLVKNGSIYALPLYIDTLAMVYNIRMFDSASIATPPKTWKELQEIIPRLRIINEKGQLTRPGIGLGGSVNTVEHAADLSFLLMLQNGATVNRSGSEEVYFGDSPKAQDAINFYMQFSNPVSDYYAWNETRKNSLDEFAAEELPIAFAYQSDFQRLKAKNQFINFGVATMPQVSLQESVNYAKYQGLTVAKQSKNKQLAWDFAIFATTDSKAASDYFLAALHPPALRSLISLNSNDPKYSVFVSQALSAKSWISKDYSWAENMIGEALSKIISGQSSISQALKEAQNRINTKR